MTPSIRPATVADAPHLAAMEEALFSDPWSEGAVASHLSAPHNHALVALSDDRIVGYCIYSSLLGEAELLRIAVAPELRRCGIARALLSEMLSLTASDTVYLEVRSQNTPAITLYERFGFRANGTRRNYYKNPGDDALLMLRTPDNT